VIVRTPDTMVGYWNDTLATFEVLRDGWMRTGDLARADDDGYLWLEGRVRDLIVRDGSNIAPAEVEDVALRNPDVSAAAAVGVPDPPHGEGCTSSSSRPRTSATGSPLGSGRASKESLRAVAVPSALHLLDDLPLNAAGKVDKNRLRERVAG